MSPSKVDKDKNAQIKELTPKLPISDTNTHLYKDELTANNLSKGLSQSPNEASKHLNGDLVEIDVKKVKQVEIESKKPRLTAKDDLNAQKCRFSPFAYHRYTRSHKEKTKSGSVIMVLRCRYCFEMQQVIIDFVLKDGRYVAQKTTSAVLEGPQTL